MVSLKNRSKGFTIVELLIVIVVIGILATIVIVTFTGVQRSARNSQRQTDINAVASHVEVFQAANGYYPTLKDLQTSTFVSAQLKGLDPQALVDPKGGSTTITNAATQSQYGYVASASSSSTLPCDNTASSDPATNACDQYVLTAKLEGAADFVKKSN